MSTAINTPGNAAAPELAPHEDAMRRQVWTLLAGLFPTNRQCERRTEQRFPYPYLVQLTPVGADGTTQLGDPVVVVGKHLSERGLGFYHPQPLPFRRMIATLTAPANESVHFLIDITWCRFTGPGWYDSGGRFLRAVTDPPAGARSA